MCRRRSAPTFMSCFHVLDCRLHVGFRLLTLLVALEVRIVPTGIFPDPPATPPLWSFFPHGSFVAL